MYFLDRYGNLRKPRPNDVPWPCVWAAARHNRKHITCGKTGIDKDRVLRSLIDAENKLHWKLKLRNTEDPLDRFGPLHRKLLKVPKPFIGIRTPEVSAFFGEFRRTLFRYIDGAKERRSRQSTDDHALVGLGFKMLLYAGLLAVPTDKDGGFCITSVANVSSFIRSVVSNGNYVRVFPEVVNGQNVFKIQKEYNRWCCLASSTYEIGALAPRLAGSWNHPDTVLSSHLKINIKTHKTPTKVRDICACPKWKMANLAHFVHAIVSDKLRHFSHLVVDTSQFLAKLNKLEANSNDIFVKFDVADFFMSGSSSELSFSVSRLFENDGEKVRNFVQGVVFFLLENQFVSVGYPDGAESETYKLAKGSGMGLAHSGSVADAALLVAAEYGKLDPSIQAGVKLFCRFRDDGILIAKSRTEAVAFGQQYRNSAAPFKIKCEQVSATELEWLEVVIRKDLANGVFYTIPRIKSTSFGCVMLESSSRHTFNTHISWPKAFLERRLKLCGRMADKLVFRNRALQRFESELCTNRVLKMLAEVPLEGKVARSSQSNSVTWVVLPHFPLFFGIAIPIRRFLDSHSFLVKEIFGSDHEVKVAWSTKHLRNISQRASRLQIELSGLVGGINNNNSSKVVSSP